MKSAVTLKFPSKILLIAVSCSCSLVPGLSQTIPGIPEPGLIMYGTVRNSYSNTTYRLTAGTLNWRITAATPSKTINVSIPLTNLVDQFSYVVQIPYETIPPGSGFVLSGNALQLNSSATLYTRSATVNSQSSNIAPPTQPTYSFSGPDRGRIERVDLTVSIPFTDTDHDGLPDDWEMQYFGKLIYRANDDLDHDGISNLAELQAGTNPNEFRLISVQPAQLGGLTLQWVSQDFSTFDLQRATNAAEPFVSIQTNIPASGLDLTAFRDRTATNRGPYFYRVGGQ